MVRVATLAQVQSLAQELSHAVDSAKKKKEGVPAVAQQVKDPALFLQWPGFDPQPWLRIQLCCSYGTGHSYSSDSIPGPGTSMYCGCS